jgi:hypothetical protein
VRSRHLRIVGARETRREGVRGCLFDDGWVEEAVVGRRNGYITEEDGGRR